MKDEVIRVENKFIGQKFEHTNLSKLGKKRIKNITFVK